MAAALLLLSVTPTVAQGPPTCEPIWGLPRLGNPEASAVSPAPYSLIGQPSAQDGPALPLIILENTRPTTAGYSLSELSDSPGVEVHASGLNCVAGELRIVACEAFFHQLIARCDTDAGPVQDVVLGANVTGSQNTLTQVTVDVQPSDQTARLILQLTGTTINQTVGVTPQAAVSSRGAHQFLLTKQIDFDGLRFTTRSPAAWVMPQLTNQGAATPLSGVPLLGTFASQIALTEADRRRPLAEQIVTLRLTGQVAPRFNDEVDQRLAEFNRRLAVEIPRLLAVAGLAPVDSALTSTDTQILYGLRLPGEGASPPQKPSALSGEVLPGEPSPLPEPAPGDADSDLMIIRQFGSHRSSEVSSGPAAVVAAAAPPREFHAPPEAAAGRSVTVAIHEDFVNHLLRQLPLSGTEVADRTIDRVLSLLADGLSGSGWSNWSLDGEKETAEFATILLAAGDPLQVRFDSGQVVVIARAGFRPLLAPEVPAQEIGIPFTLSPEGGSLRLVPGEVSVEPLSASGSAPLLELAGPIIRQQVANRLEPLSLPTSLPVRVPGRAATTLTIRDVTLADGWLVIAVD